MTRTSTRPISPHLTIWRWGPAMTVSILHRVTGNGLATAGAILLVGWLAAAASGPEPYAEFMSWLTWWPGIVVMVGISWFFFQHMTSGLRHFVLDTGAGYGLEVNRTWSLATIAISTMLTALLWLAIFWGGV